MPNLMVRKFSLNAVEAVLIGVGHQFFHRHASESHFGLSYDPNNEDGTYKTTAQITEDFKHFKNRGFHHVRSYRTDFNQVGHMLDACEASGMKLFPSTYQVTDNNVEIPALINDAKGRWHLITNIGIGNEDVNSGTASVQQVIDAVNQARGMLRNAGYKGAVVHADTFNQYEANPDLCQAGDWVAANCHAFFDTTMEASNAAQYVMDQHDKVKSVCGGKHTGITESGWPSGGNANGAAVPSPENQATVINGLKKLFAGRSITLFMAYNAQYKATDSGDPTEAYWGILG